MFVASERICNVVPVDDGRKDLMVLFEGSQVMLSVIIIKCGLVSHFFSFIFLKIFL